MNRWNLALVVVDYVRLRRRQLGREPSEEEIRAVNGFAEYLIALDTAEEVTHSHDQNPGVAV